MHGPAVPLAHPLHWIVGVDVRVVKVTTKGVVVEGAVEVLVWDSQILIPSGHDWVAALSYAAQIVVPGYAQGPDVEKEHSLQSPATSIIEASTMMAMLAKRGKQPNQSARRIIDL